MRAISSCSYVPSTSRASSSSSVNSDDATWLGHHQNFGSSTLLLGTRLTLSSTVSAIMRSLTPTNHVVYEAGPSSGLLRITKAAIDPETGAVYATIERRDEGVEVDIVRLEVNEEGTRKTEVSPMGCVLVKFHELTKVKPIANFTSPVLSPFSLPKHAGEVVDVHYFAGDQSLVLLLYGGDIATLQIEGPDGGPGPVSHIPEPQAMHTLIYQVEVVGSIDSGIRAAAWSPDEEHLILVTGMSPRATVPRGRVLMSQVRTW